MARVGYKQTLEHIEKCRIARRGKPSSMRGKKHSEEAKRKIGAASSRILRERGHPMQGRKHTAETKEKMRGPRGAQTPEWIAKKTAARIANGHSRPSPEHMARLQAGRERSRIPFRDTQPERLLQQRLHDSGVWFVKHAIVAPLARRLGIRHRFDVVLPQYRLAFEIDGCWFHGCVSCYPNPREWQVKARARDSRIDAAFTKLPGWTLIRIPEHALRGVR